MGTYKSWAPLWSTIVGSSLWDEPDWVVKIFLTMMAMKDMDHIYRNTTYALARESRKTEQEVIDALKILSSPDTRRVNDEQDYEGRRIKSVEEGWLILNADKYRREVQLEMKRNRDRRAQSEYRKRQALKKSLAPEPKRTTSTPDDVAAQVAAQAPPDPPTSKSIRRGLDERVRSENQALAGHYRRFAYAF